ncbi:MULTISPECIES: hypothetical protein [Streptomyces]|uniref:Uncharacterized protein n=1 Tax=Streptomyces antimycoticus TaxID=68175 RepID=A0A499UH40_9ACTN|nr:MULTISPECIES: hypothetical protein [Streptomyces]QTI89379.1 hypothetical protein AS97_53350 [Streptomyces sp. AgN23]WTB05358.1 hypothetical protein OG546_14715 [Streptomyces antimycoticus]BBJ40813.1 hypothetical protein SSPO_035310 [Streptomyces antimycoticus]
MSADTPSPPPKPPTAHQDAGPSPSTAALDELWRMADELGTAVRAHLDARRAPSRPASATTDPTPPERDR